MNNSPKPVRYLRPLLEADLIVLLRNKRVVVVSVLLPMYILLMAGTPKTQSAFGGSSVLVMFAITAGLLSLALIGYGAAVARDRERGVFQRLRVTPAPTWTIVVSRLLIQVVGGLVLAIAVLVAGGLMGRISLSGSEYVYTLLLAMLESAMLLSIGQAIVGLVKSAAVVNGLGGLLYAVFAISGLVGFGSGTQSSALQTFGKFTPVGAVLTLFQSATHQVAWNGHTTLSLLACFGYIAVCLTVGIRWFKWEAR